MARSLPESPGWYPDPDILAGVPSALRYWDGRHWTDRRRPAPILATLHLDGNLGAVLPRALEGPARPAELPAPAAEVSAGRDGSGGRAETLDRPAKAEARDVGYPTAAGGGRGGPPQPPGGGGGGGGPGGEGSTGRERGNGTGSHRKWWLFAGIGVLCAVAVILIGEALRPKSPGPPVLTDAQWVRSANTLCARTMPSLRPSDGGAFGSLVSPALAADGIDKAATGLDNLADRLAALPVTPADKPHITGWLTNWHRYATAGRQYADFLRQHGATSQPPAVLNTAAGIARQSDDFALANDLKSCQFAYVDTSNANSF